MNLARRIGGARLARLAVNPARHIGGALRGDWIGAQLIRYGAVVGVGYLLSVALCA